MQQGVLVIVLLAKVVGQLFLGGQGLALTRHSLTKRGHQPDHEHQASEPDDRVPRRDESVVVEPMDVGDLRGDRRKPSDHDPPRPSGIPGHDDDRDQIEGSECRPRTSQVVDDPQGNDEDDAEKDSRRRPDVAQEAARRPGTVPRPLALMNTHGGSLGGHWFYLEPSRQKLRLRLNLGCQWRPRVPPEGPGKPSRGG